LCRVLTNQKFWSPLLWKGLYTYLSLSDGLSRCSNLSLDSSVKFLHAWMEEIKINLFTDIIIICVYLAGPESSIFQHLVAIHFSHGVHCITCVVILFNFFIYFSIKIFRSKTITQLIDNFNNLDQLKKKSKNSFNQNLWGWILIFEEYVQVLNKLYDITWFRVVCA
jgi:hypothetical protein